MLRRLADLARLTHPFPSAVDAAVVAAIAALDQARGPVVVGLAASMFLLQAAIGSVNDLVDVERDRGRPHKAIAAGRLPASTARILGVMAGFLGLALAAAVAPAVLGVAAACLGVGLAYDLRLRGTALSWLPFAIGIPLLPVFAWVGGSGCAPPAAALLVPLGVVAGAQLALANALADLERDAAAAVSSVATALGADRAFRLAAALAAAILVPAWLALVAFGGRGPGLGAAAVGTGLVLGSVTLLRSAGTRRRELGWAIDCVGLGLLAAGWVAALGGTGVLPVPPC